MNWSLRPTWSPIGLRVGAGSVTAVRLDQIGRIRAFASFGRREPDAPISARSLRIRSVLDRQGSEGPRLFWAPRRMIRSTTLGCRPRRPVPRSISWQMPSSARIHKAPQRSPRAFGNSRQQPGKGGPADDGRHVRPRAERRALRVFEQADLDVLALDLSVLATLRAARRRGGIARDPRTGRVSRSIAVVHNGVLLLQRDLAEMTMRRLRAGVSKQLRLPSSTTSADPGVRADPSPDAPESLADAVRRPWVVRRGDRPLGVVRLQPLRGCQHRSGLHRPRRRHPRSGEHLGESLECVRRTEPARSDPIRMPVRRCAKPGEGISALGLALWKETAA